MKRTLNQAKVLTVFGLLFLFATTAQAQNLKEEIEAANQRFIKTVGKADAAAMMKLYTKDAMLMPPNAEIISLPKDHDAFVNWAENPPPGLKLETLEVEGHGDTAIEIGYFTISTADQAQILDKGKYIVVWKKEGGKWKLHRDMYSSSMPLPTN